MSRRIGRDSDGQERASAPLTSHHRRVSARPEPVGEDGRRQHVRAVQRRLASLGLDALLVAFALSVLVIDLQPASAELENHVFTSRADRLRLVVPRGWRESDAPSYPNLLLWMMRPEAKIVLTAEPF